MNFKYMRCVFKTFLFSVIFISASSLFAQGTFQGAYYETPRGSAGGQDIRIPVNTSTIADVLHTRTSADPRSLPQPPAVVKQAEYSQESVPRVFPRASQASYEQPIAAAVSPPAPVINPTVETAMRAPSAEGVKPAVSEETEKVKMPAAEADSLLAFQEVVTTPSGTYQQITIIDPKRKSLCVYHIDMATGQSELRSARDLQWDFQLSYLNTKKPLPIEVRGILQEGKK